MEEKIADGTVETPTAEELQASLAKAEAKIVELKKANTDKEGKKEEPKTEDKNEVTSTFSKEDVEAMIKSALKENAIVSQEETFKQNQNLTNSASIGNDEPTTSSGFNSISMNEYSKMGYDAQREYMANSKKEYGEVTFKN